MTKLEGRFQFLLAPTIAIILFLDKISAIKISSSSNALLDILMIFTFQETLYTAQRKNLKIYF
jgi:hypothetical protein